MGTTKIKNFSEEQNQLSVLLKALAHPARIAILQHIISANACICGDLVNEFGLAQATISQHLKALKAAGIIKGTIEGVKICYCIDPTTWALLQKHVSHLLGSYNNHSNCC